MSQDEEQGRKRGAARQLTDRDDVDDTVESEDGGTWKKADASTMQNRKVFKVRGSKGSLERSGSGSGSDVTSPIPAAPTPASTGPFFSFANKEETPEKKEEPTNGTKPATPTKAEPAEASTTPAKDSTPTTPAKEATPVKEGGSKTTTPAKEGTTTPAKETTATPTKETPQATTPAKEEAPKTTEGTPEAPKAPAFSTPTSFSFPTSFSQSTPFSFPSLSSTTLPAFPTSSTPFAGFNFPAVNFSAGGSSVFSAGGAKKEGSDDEDEGSYNPEEEVAVNTAPSKLPVVPTVTGEEEEKTLHTVRAKLYAMIDGKWQERGVGNLKLNEGKDGKCRLLMRDEKGKHLRLNTALFSEMKVDKSGDKSVQFVAVGTGGGDAPATGPAKPFTTYAVRVGRKEEAEELYEALQKHKSTSVENAST